MRTKTWIIATVLGSCAIQAARPAHAQDAMAPAATKEYLASDFHRDILAAYRTQLGDTYLKGNGRNPKWDAAAEAALDLMARYDAENATNEVAAPGFTTDPEITDEQMGDAAQKAVDLGCSDPMLLYERGLTLILQGKAPDRQGWIEKAYAALSGSPYGMRQQSRVILRNIPADGRQDAKWQQLQDAFAKMASGPFVNKADERDVALRITQTLRTAGSADAIRKLDLLATAPGADLWLIDAVRADLEVDAVAEGVGRAQEHMTRALAAANAAYTLHPGYPEPACAILREWNFAPQMGDEARKWFQRAIAGEPDGDTAYQYLRLELGRPGGVTAEELLAAGKKAADTARYDTTIPWEYIQAMGAVHDADKAIYSRPEVKATAVGIFSRYSQQWHGTKQATFFQQASAAFAIGSEDYPGAKTLLDQTDGPLDQRAFSTLGISASKGVDDVYLHETPDRQGVGRYTQAVSRGNFANAERFIGNVIDKDKPTGRGLTVFQSLQAGAHLMASYSAGDKLSLGGEDARPFWFPVLPYSIDNGAIAFTGQDQYEIKSRYYLPDRHFRLHVAFEFQNVKAGGEFSMGWGMGDNRVGWSVMVMADSSTVTVQAPKSADLDSDHDVPFAPIAAKNTIDIVYFDGNPTLAINGKSIPMDFGASEAVNILPAKNTFQLGGNAPVRITEISLQHLAANPAPNATAPAASAPGANPPARGRGRGRRQPPQTQSDTP